MVELHRRQCHGYEERLQELAMGGLSRRRRAAMAAHLKSCSDCRRYLREARALGDALSRLPSPEPPPGLAEQIKGACLVAAVFNPSAPRVAWTSPYAAATVTAAFMMAALSYLPVARTAAMHRAEVTGVMLGAVPAAETPQAMPALAAGPAALVSDAGSARHDAGYARRAPGTATRYRRWGTPAAAIRLATARVTYGGPAEAPVAGPAAPRALATTLPAHGVSLAPASATPLAQPVRIAMGAASTGDRRAAVPDDRGEAVNGQVATGLAAGVFAGAVLDRYLADAVARRGAELATEARATGRAADVQPASPVIVNVAPASF
jgi:hypothetical protein